VDTGLPWLAREAEGAMGSDRLVICERDLVSVNQMRAALPDLEIKHTARPDPDQGDLVILPLGKNRQGFFLELERLGHLVGPDGLLAVYGGNKEGARPAQDFLSAHCRIEEPRTKGGARLLLAHPTEIGEWDVERPTDHYLATARGETVKVAARPGLFSWNHLDPATEALLERCLPREGDNLLDLGCGAGVVGAIMLAEGKVATATLTDSDSAALVAAGQTMDLNRLTAEITPSDAATELPDKQFNLIICNPPFHRGFAGEKGTVQRMIEEAWRVLAAKGRLYIVGPHTLRIGSHLAEVFQNHELLFEEPRFQVWRAVRRRRTRRNRGEEGGFVADTPPK
jgi:16S rRNA (guanine1207-N2)-methyltransferase